MLIADARENDGCCNEVGGKTTVTYQTCRFQEWPFRGQRAGRFSPPSRVENAIERHKAYGHPDRSRALSITNPSKTGVRGASFRKQQIGISFQRRYGILCALNFEQGLDESQGRCFNLQ